MGNFELLNQNSHIFKNLPGQKQGQPKIRFSGKIETPASGVMVAVRTQIGECLAMWILTAKMCLRRPGRMLAQWPSSPCRERNGPAKKPGNLNYVPDGLRQ